MDSAKARSARRLLAALGAGFCATGCGSGGGAGTAADLRPPASDPSLVPGRLSADPAFHPPVVSAAALAGRPVGRLRCTPARGPWTAAHVEVFARRRVVLIPAGIGIAGARVRTPARVGGARCAYPLLTADPTGVVRVRAGARVTLADLFALWGRPLDPDRMLSFTGAVRAWVGGRRRRGAPGHIVLARGAQIVLEVGGYVPPHPRYSFPRGFL